MTKAVRAMDLGKHELSPPLERRRRPGTLTRTVHPQTKDAPFGVDQDTFSRLARARASGAPSHLNQRRGGATTEWARRWPYSQAKPPG
jgi:hypothetical protein